MKHFTNDIIGINGQKNRPILENTVNQHSEFNLKDIFLYLFILGIFNVKIFVRFFLHWKGLIEEIVGNKEFTANVWVMKIILILSTTIKF